MMKRVTHLYANKANRGFSTVGFILNLVFLGLIVGAITGKVEWGTVGLALVGFAVFAFLWGLLVGRISR